MHTLGSKVWGHGLEHPAEGCYVGILVGGLPEGFSLPCRMAAVKLCSLSESSAYLNATAVGITSGLIQSRLGAVSMLDASSAAAVQI